MINSLGSFFGETEFAEVIAGNLGQDHVSGQIGHPEYHFDDSEFDRTYAYLDKLKNNVVASARPDGSFYSARMDFGRFTHAIQDFYAHSNYVRLWAQNKNVSPTTWNGDIDFLDEGIIKSPELISGHFYTPWEMITFIPYLGSFLGKLFPKDSHTALNNDSPRNNPWFPLAFKAAELRTRYESGLLFDRLYKEDPNNLFKFLGKPFNPFKGV